MCGRATATDLADPQSEGVGLHSEVTFTHYSKLSSAAQITRRLMSPLAQLRTLAEAERTQRTLEGQPVDLTKERFLFYMPKGDPPGEGYALLVFVPPWPKAQVPPEWIPALDLRHMIMVSAEQSGNETSPFNRRVPLALLALENLRARFPIDPSRTFVGGFSGGSRIALRLLLGYPDQFRGALLNAGSDAVGGKDLPLPAGDLLKRVQESTRLVYLTGERDEPHLVDDMNSRTSLKRWCIFDVIALNEPRRDHQPADAPSFEAALSALLSPRSEAPALKSCQEQLNRRLDEEIERVAALNARGDPHAHAALEALDIKYGGLAAPRSLELAQH